MSHFASVDEYLASFDGTTKDRLIKLRALLKQLMPNAEERISYNIPAYFIDGKHVVYMAGYANHVGMYPGRTNSAAFNALAAKYAHGKSTVRFSNAEPLPADLIKQFIAVRLKEL